MDDKERKAKAFADSILDKACEEAYEKTISNLRKSYDETSEKFLQVFGEDARSKIPEFSQVTNVDVTTGLGKMLVLSFSNRFMKSFDEIAEIASSLADSDNKA